MEPPFVPAMYGNFQIAPRPTAEPALAKIKPMRDPHRERSAMSFIRFIVLVGDVEWTLKVDQIVSP
mgnify:CR=1 FL=1